MTKKRIELQVHNEIIFSSCSYPNPYWSVVGVSSNLPKYWQSVTSFSFSRVLFCQMPQTTRLDLLIVNKFARYFGLSPGFTNDFPGKNLTDQLVVFVFPWEVRKWMRPLWLSLNKNQQQDWLYLLIWCLPTLGDSKVPCRRLRNRFVWYVLILSK